MRFARNNTRFNSRFTTVVAGAAVIGLLGGGIAVAAATIGSADIVDNSIKSKDIRDNTVKLADISNSAERKLKGQQGPAGPEGPAGPAGPAGSGATYAGPNWSIVDRNVVKNGDSYLRAGPGTPPLGVGSLGIRTGDANDKSAFGNQVDFLGQTLASINTVKYSIYTTGENNTTNSGGNAENGPSVAFEIDPNGPAVAGGFSTLVYVPTALTANAWNSLDASTNQRWFLTGATGTSTGCNQTTYCTLAGVKAALPDATLYVAQITKGRDYAFSGAVDQLVINADTYDFEPFGVTKATAS